LKFERGEGEGTGVTGFRDYRGKGMGVAIIHIVQYSRRVLPLLTRHYVMPSVTYIHAYLYP
jgi:hypothetical protein